jgi:hypothetical protein
MCGEQNMAAMLTTGDVDDGSIVGTPNEFDRTESATVDEPTVGKDERVSARELNGVESDTADDTEDRTEE